uniref:Uncharacterized protein n=1 Tax=Romanomermis culicivorax TaxID=13658 RepID=A0A915JZL9_ROMCU
MIIFHKNLHSWQRRPGREILSSDKSAKPGLHWQTYESAVSTQRACGWQSFRRASKHSLTTAKKNFKKVERVPKKIYGGSVKIMLGSARVLPGVVLLTAQMRQWLKRHSCQRPLTLIV